MNPPWNLNKFLGSQLFKEGQRVPLSHLKGSRRQPEVPSLVSTIARKTQVVEHGCLNLFIACSALAAAEGRAAAGKAAIRKRRRPGPVLLPRLLEPKYHLCSRRRPGPASWSLR